MAEIPVNSQSADKLPKKKIFPRLFFGCFCVLIAFLTYFFLQEYEIIIKKKPAALPTPEASLAPLASSSPVISPEPETSSQIKILDGNVISDSDGQTTILVNKDDYEQIEEFTQVFVSEDQEKMCFLGQTMVPLRLFLSQADGSNVVQVAVAKNCVWDHQSQQIAFNNHTTDVSPVDVLVYDLASKQTKNLTESISLQVLDAVKNWEVYRFYKNPLWSADDSQITTEYDYLHLDTSGAKGSGISLINLKTGKVEDQ